MLSDVTVSAAAKFARGHVFESAHSPQCRFNSKMRAQMRRGALLCLYCICMESTLAFPHQCWCL